MHFYGPSRIGFAISLSIEPIVTLDSIPNKLYTYLYILLEIPMFNPEVKITDNGQVQSPDFAQDCHDICPFTLALDVSGRAQERVSQTNRAIIDGTFGSTRKLNALERRRTIPCGAEDCPTMLQLTVRTERGITSYIVTNPEELTGGCSVSM
jgi:hypothetical protein